MEKAGVQEGGSLATRKRPLSKAEGEASVASLRRGAPPLDPFRHRFAA